MPEVQEQLILIGAVGIATACALCLAIYFALKAKAEKTVREESPRIAILAEINARYRPQFADIEGVKESCIQLSSKAQYDRYDPSRQLTTLVGENPEYFEQWINHARSNATLWASYQLEVEAIQPSRYQRKTYALIEQTQFDAMLLSPPVAFPCLRVRWSYTSPQGQNKYRSEKDFHAYDILFALESLRAKNQRSAQIAHERAAMTDAMRYSVMARDNFACVLCGSTADDGVKLHVDHIFPVSKGGKTVMSNLRTLCDRCNLGKSDRIEN